MLLRFGALSPILRTWLCYLQEAPPSGGRLTCSRTSRGRRSSAATARRFPTNQFGREAASSRRITVLGLDGGGVFWGVGEDSALPSFPPVISFAFFSAISHCFECKQKRVPSSQLDFCSGRFAPLPRMEHSFWEKKEVNSSLRVPLSYRRDVSLGNRPHIPGAVGVHPRKRAGKQTDV